MDFLKDLGGNKNEGAAPPPTGGEAPKKEGGGIFDQASNYLNNAAGGGAKGEKNEDYLDKGIDYVQENFMGQGQQSNETAIEQAKDEKIADFIRDQYKTQTGKNFPGGSEEPKP